MVYVLRTSDLTANLQNHDEGKVMSNDARSKVIMYDFWRNTRASWRHMLMLVLHLILRSLVCEHQWFSTKLTYGMIVLHTFISVCCLCGVLIRNSSRIMRAGIVGFVCLQSWDRPCQVSCITECRVENSVFKHVASKALDTIGNYSK